MDRQSISEAKTTNNELANKVSLNRHYDSKNDIKFVDSAESENIVISNSNGIGSFNHDFSTVPTGIQTKLKIGEENDQYEQEADRVADRIMRMPDPNSSSFSSISHGESNNSIQRKCFSCSEDDELIQRKPFNAGGIELNTAVSSSINSISGGGRSMSQSERGFFEPRFRSKFSNVRIHENNHANQLASSINARAFTLGNNVVFAAGEYSSESETGKRLLAHELTHVRQQSGNSRLVQRHATQQARMNRICYRNANQEPTPNAQHPEQHPTYEQWLASFAGLAEFRADDTFHPTDPNATDHVGSRFRVLGRQGRQFGDTSVRDIANHTPEEDHTHAQETLPVPVSGRARDGEEFIDHPTNDWVVNCLPANLRATAFQLPSDCADIAVILRHVWLAAHNRTESYGRWTVGSGARRRRREIIAGDSTGNANQGRVRGLITDVFSGNVHRMVNGYSNESGGRLNDFNQIQNLLHPGDILAWEHKKVTSRINGRVRARRTGGHVQTISEIVRNGNDITAIRVLQGNQPIFKGGAEEIMGSRGVQNPDGDSPEGKRLRALPSRRIERSNAISLDNIEDPVTGSQIWGEIDDPPGHTGPVSEYTTLVSAGPPRAASRPRASGRGRQRVRRISDWFSNLRSVSLARLYGTLEAALLEARSIIDGGNAIPNSDANTLGANAGENLWSKATASVRRLLQVRSRSNSLLSGDVGSRTHFEPLHRMRAMIRSLGGIQPSVYRGNPNAAANVRRTFLRIDSEFNFSARGGSSVSFNRRVQRGGEIVKVLVTGFDPFSANPPPGGDWNPAGATALALDNNEVTLGNRNKAAIESVVFPVSFAQFNQGIVERVVRSANADAVLTISLLPRLANGSPVQIEQFTVGMHRLTALQPHRLFPSESITPGDRGIGSRGNAIIETGANLQGIASDAVQTGGRNRTAVARPTIASDITFRFNLRSTAQRFLNVLGLQQRAISREVVISDSQAIRNIINNSVRISDRRGLTARIRVTINNTQFRPTILDGPGGSFLSNEVAYRTQRELQQQNRSAVSFHTHVPNVDQSARIIPPNGTNEQRRNALWSARSSINRLVATMRRLIRAVGIRIIGQRNQGNSTNNSSNP